MLNESILGIKNHKKKYVCNVKILRFFSCKSMTQITLYVKQNKETQFLSAAFVDYAPYMT